MADKDYEGYELHFKYRGLFDMNGLFSVISDWFETKGFEFLVTKVKTKARTFGYEDDYEMKGWKDETDLHRTSIIVYIHTWDTTMVDVIVDGQKKKLTKGRFYMSISGKLEFDYSGRFEGSMFFKGLRTFMRNQVTKHRYDAIWTDLHHYKMHELHNNIKEFFDMQTKGKYFKNMW